MREHLTVDGKDLADFGVYISGDGTFSAPEKDYDWYDVPSRNGAVLGYERRLKNISVSYDCGIYTNFDTNISDLRNYLLSRNGLVRISDTYHTGEYRMGIYAGSFDPTVERTLDAGRFTLTFDCLPQRWLTTGETAITISGGGGTITNPTRFDAKPLVNVRGYGNLTINGTSIVIDNYGGTDLTIDCETMNCYNGTGTQTEYVAFVKNLIYGVDAPVLSPGSNTITNSSTSTLTSVIITPRWWEV